MIGSGFIEVLLMENNENLKNNENELDASQNTSIHDVKNYFESISLTSSQKMNLESILLAKSPSFLSILINFYSKQKLIIFSNFVTAMASIVVTLGLVYVANEFSFNLSQDVLTEADNLSENLNFPADFNLDGNLNNLPDLINDSLPNKSFTPKIPTNIAKDYSAYEGRFFLYKGDQGVGITVSPSQNLANFPVRLEQGLSRKGNSTLYIVKLSDKNKSCFPIKKTSRKIYSSSGKSKRIYAWREGFYGFAIIQP
jgi:hypothetical protein